MRLQWSELRILWDRNSSDSLWTPNKLTNEIDGKETQRVSPDVIYRNPLFYINMKEQSEYEKTEKKIELSRKKINKTMARYSKIAMKKFKPKQISEERVFIHKLNKEILKPKEEAMMPKAKKNLNKLLDDIKVKVKFSNHI